MGVYIPGAFKNKCLVQEKKEEEPGEFDWKINVQRLRIEKLNFVMLGSKPVDITVQALQLINEKSFYTENLSISNFIIETRIQYDKHAVQIWISYLGFKTNFGFDLKGERSFLTILRKRNSPGLAVH